MENNTFLKGGQKGVHEQNFYAQFDNATLKQILDKEVENVIEKLNLKQIKGDDKDVVAAAILADFLYKITNFDMGVKLNVKQQDERLRKYKNIAWRRDNKIRDLTSKSKTFENESQRYLINKQIEKLRSKNLKTNQKVLKEKTRVDNNFYLNQMISVLIGKKGVCEEISKTYQYMLDKVGIKSYTIVFAPSHDDDFWHVFNVVECKINGKTQYYVVDVTNCGIHALPEDVELKDFAIPIEDQKRRMGKEAFWEVLKLSKDKNLKENLLSKKEYRYGEQPQIFEGMLSREDLANSINKASKIIKNKYSLKEVKPLLKNQGKEF